MAIYQPLLLLSSASALPGPLGFKIVGSVGTPQGQHEISGRAHTCELKLQGNSHAFRVGLRRCRVFKFAFAIL